MTATRVRCVSCGARGAACTQRSGFERRSGSSRSGLRRRCGWSRARSHRGRCTGRLRRGHAGGHRGCRLTRRVCRHLRVEQHWGPARRTQGGAAGTPSSSSSSSGGKGGSTTAREAKAAAAARGGGVRSNGAHNATAGAVAGVIVSLCLHPVDTLKVRPTSLRARHAVCHGKHTTAQHASSESYARDALTNGTLTIHYPTSEPSHTGAHPVQRHLLRAPHPACAVRLCRVARRARVVRGPRRQFGCFRAHQRHLHGQLRSRQAAAAAASEHRPRVGGALLCGRAGVGTPPLPTLRRSCSATVS